MDPLTIVMGLAQFAPALIKWATGSSRVEAIADKALGIAKEITGTNDYADAITRLRGDPVVVTQFQHAIVEQEKEFEELYIQDKKDARARDVALSSTPQGNVRANWLAGMAVLVVGTILSIVVLKSSIDEFAKGVLTTILGVFLQQLNNIYAFEFGTTRRSREKSDLLDNISSK